MRSIDMANRRFGLLVALGPTSKRNGSNIVWLFRCDCGQEREISGNDVRGGHTSSCGCLRPDHGESGSLQHTAWKGMLARCGNPRHKYFKHYGGRGITVVPRWLLYANFLADMGRRPTPKHTIDRVDNDGNYEPGNCRWATRKEQAANRRPREGYNE